MKTRHTNGAKESSVACWPSAALVCQDESRAKNPFCANSFHFYFV